MVNIFKIVVISVFILINSANVFGQHSLMDSLIYELKLGCVDTSQLNTQQDFCDIGEKNLECAIDCKKLFNIFRAIQHTKNPDLIDQLLDLEDLFFEYLKPIWKFYDKEYIGSNCRYIRNQYDIGIAFEETIKSLRITKDNKSPHEIYKEFIVAREFWTRGYVSDTILLKHPFFKKNRGRFFGTKYNIDFIDPYIDSLTEKDFEEDIRTLFKDFDFYDKWQYGKWRLTGKIMANFKNKKFNLIYKENKTKLLWEAAVQKPLFSLILHNSEEIEDIKYLIDILFDEVDKMYYHNKFFPNSKGALALNSQLVIEENFKTIISAGKETFVRNYLEEKMLNEAKNTNTLHKTTQVLGGYYHDEKMLKVLLSINKHLEGDIEKKKLLVLLEPYESLVKEYPRKLRKKYKKIIHKLIKL